MLRRDFDGHLQEGLQVFIAVAYVHRRPREDIRGPYQHRIADFVDEVPDIVHRGQLLPARLVDAQRIDHRRELVAVFRPVDVVGVGSQDVDATALQRQGQVVGDLAADADHHAVWFLDGADLQDGLEAEFVEVEPVAAVVVGRNGLRVVVDDDGLPASLPEGIHGVDPAPVEFDAAADAVGAGTQDDDGPRAVVGGNDVVLAPVVGQIQVVGPGREFGGQRIDLFDARMDAQGEPPLADLGLRPLVHTGDLDVGKTLPFGPQEKIAADGGQRRAGFQFAVGRFQGEQFVEEPAVDAGQFVDALHAVARFEGRRNGEDARVGGMRQGPVEVFHLVGFVADEAVGALPDHPEAFLDGFFEGAADGHHLADAFHAGSDLPRDALEFGQVPAGNLAHHVVQRGFEKGGGRLCDRILQFEKSVAQAEFGRHESQRITGRFRGKGRRAAQPRVDFDHAVVIPVGTEGILHVAFADDAQVAHDVDGFLPQEMEFVVGQGLRGSHYDALARMDAQRVEILHVADGDAVVVAVAYDLVFNLFPAPERFLHQHLRREGEGLPGRRLELGRIVAEAGAQSAQRISRPQDDGVAHLRGRIQRFRDGSGGVRADGLHADLVEPPDEEVAVFGVDDRLDGRPQHADAVPRQHAAPVQFHAAVEGGLPAEREEDALRFFFLDDLFDKYGRHRQEIDLVGDAFGGLHGGDVGVDQHGLNAFFAKGFQGLGAAVVEFARLADFQGARAQQQHFLYGFVQHDVRVWR